MLLFFVMYTLPTLPDPPPTQVNIDSNGPFQFGVETVHALAEGIDDPFDDQDQQVMLYLLCSSIGGDMLYLL
jgi:hypothetical protein